MPLEKLIQRIILDASEYADGVLNEAKLKLLAMRKKAEEDAERRYAEILAEARRVAEQEKQKRITVALLDGRQEVLTEKRRIIEEVLDRAVRSILSLPHEQYLDMLSRELFEVALDGGGELLLSIEDHPRLGDELASRTNRMIEEAGGAGRVTLSQETRDITGGFILKSASIETNCSLDAQIKTRRDEIEEKIIEIMFSSQSWSSSLR